MMANTAPTIASHIMPAWIAACSTSSLAKKPNIGGTPASENIASSIRNAIHGELWFKPRRSSISSHSKPARDSARITPNEAMLISA